jgi:tRNA A64-2'-O-ribosylphosphate transferase
MPDALSKTVPIWCAVLNRLFFPSKAEYHKLYVPPQVVSPSEHAQIEERLEAFLAQLKVASPSLYRLRTTQTPHFAEFGH